jgi:hypothetical protein
MHVTEQFFTRKGLDYQLFLYYIKPYIDGWVECCDVDITPPDDHQIGTLVHVLSY